MMSNISQNNYQTKTLKIDGMTCQACATRLEKVLNKKQGVQSAEVNFASETLTVALDKTVSDDELLTWVKKTGFTGQIFQKITPPKTQKPPYQLLTLALLSAPFWVGMVGMLFGSHALMLPVWLQFVLASVVQVAFGRKFYQGAYASLKSGVANMDVLVALGTSAIWAYSLFVWLGGDEHGVYFEASVMVIAFISLGKYLEARTKRQSLDAVAGLVAILPNLVKLKQGDTYQSVPLDTITTGDVLQVGVGDTLACDGQVVSGVGMLSQANLTGESLLVERSVGDMVLAGSQVVDGALEYQVLQISQDSVLGKMTQALSQAQSTKANIARLADRVAGVFVPVVVALSLLTFVGALGWGLTWQVALLRAVAVLVVACPCALGLATPVAIMAGMGLGAKHGVMFKDAPSLEQAGSIDTMIFDKTGTLTQGIPSVAKIELLGKFDKERILSITASLERHANHPLARAIVDYAKALPVMDVQGLTNSVGQGLMGHIDGVGVVKVGKLEFACMGDYQPTMNASVVAVAVDDEPVAVIYLTDTLKSDSQNLIKRLQQDGVSVVMLSGDRQETVDSTARTLGIDQALGNQLPQDKADFVKHLQDKGKKVAMVGDGVNDALAMTQADASFAVDGASDVVRHASSAWLVGQTLSHAYLAWRIAKMTLSVIKQNLFFAFIYNIFGIGMAMAGVLSPMWAGLLMALSSLSVMVNALRLKWLKLAG